MIGILVIYSRKFISYIEKLSKGVCNDADPLTLLPMMAKFGGGSEFGMGYFTALVCGEPFPEYSEYEEKGPSLETLCYLYNYDRFAHHEAGPDDGDVPMIMQAGWQYHDDVVDGVDVCVRTYMGNVEGHAWETLKDMHGLKDTHDSLCDSFDGPLCTCDCSNPREFMKNMLNKGMFFVF